MRRTSSLALPLSPANRHANASHRIVCAHPPHAEAQSPRERHVVPTEVQLTHRAMLPSRIDFSWHAYC